MELLRPDLIWPFVVDLVGFAASAATLSAFAQKQMMPMRISAIVANLFFVSYGALGLFYPVLVLHLILLPLNIARLVQQIGLDRATCGAREPEPHLTLVEEWQQKGERFSYAAANLVPEHLLDAANTQLTRHSAAS
jgi:hypothetical protein